MNTPNPRTPADHAEPGHVLVFSHPGAEPRTTRREPRKITMPDFRAPSLVRP